MLSGTPSDKGNVQTNKLVVAFTPEMITLKFTVLFYSRLFALLPLRTLASGVIMKLYNDASERERMVNCWFPILPFYWQPV